MPRTYKKVEMYTGKQKVGQVFKSSKTGVCYQIVKAKKRIICPEGMRTRKYKRKSKYD